MDLTSTYLGAVNNRMANRCPLTLARGRLSKSFMRGSYGVGGRGDRPTSTSMRSLCPNCPRPQHSAAMWAMVGKLPRGRKLAAVMPEYGATTVCRVVASSNWPQVTLPDARMGRALRVIGDFGINLKRGSAVEEKFVGTSFLCVVGISPRNKSF